MVAELKVKKRSENKSSRKQKNYKIYRFLEKNVFIIVWLIILIVLLVGSIFPYIYYKNLDKTYISIKSIFYCTIIGIAMGCFLTVWTKMWYDKRISDIKSRESIRNYSRLIKADMERTSRLFKNKRFMLVKISSITVMKNWIEAFAKVSSQLTKVEMQQVFNYYSQVDKLSQYEDRINKHLEIMQCGALKDYPYMKEYKELIECFTIEIGILFKVDVNLIKEKLVKLCGGEF